MSQNNETTQQTQSTTPAYTRRQGRISKTWNGAFDIVDSVAGTTKDVVVHAGGAVSSTVKLANTGITGISQIGIISMNAMTEEVITDAVLNAIQSKQQITATLTEAGMKADEFEIIKASLLKGSSL